MNEYEVSDIRVIDGDTFDCKIALGFDITLSQRIRLKDIDTPECRTKDPEEKRYGNLAKKELIRLVKSAKKATIACHPTREKFGRVLAELWLDESSLFDEPCNVNQYLCDKHFAVPYSGQSKEEIAEQHLANRKLLDAS